MTTALHRLLLVTLAIAVPAAVFAQPAPATRADPPAEALTAQDRDVLTAAEQLAAEIEQLIEQWITTQAITLDRLFARLYFPITEPRSDPQKYSAPYAELAEHDLPGPEDKTLALSPALLYAILTDSNGYVPVHNTRFKLPLTGNTAQDYVNNRTQRLLGDITSLTAARSEAHHLLQRAKLETGDVIYDLSVPVTVRGRHWGCVRIGYRRTE